MGENGTPLICRADLDSVAVAHDCEGIEPEIGLSSEDKALKRVVGRESIWSSIFRRAREQRLIARGVCQRDSVESARREFQRKIMGREPSAVRRDNGGRPGRAVTVIREEIPFRNVAHAICRAGSRPSVIIRVGGGMEIH